MSLAHHLIHRCTIRRPSTQPNPYGEAARSATTVVATNRPCRLVISSQRVLDTVDAERPRVTMYKLLVGAGTSVLEGDEVVDLTLEDGSVMESVLVVEAILPRRARALHHTTLEVKRVS